MKKATTCAFLLLPLLLGGCENNLIFMERSGFNLAIDVNENPVTPVHVNAGMMRSIVALVPGRANDNSGEAVSLISGYDLAYEDKAGGFFNDKLVIRSQFASGAAANKIAESPDIAKKIVNPTLTVMLSKDVETRAAAARTKIVGLSDDNTLTLVQALNNDKAISKKFNGSNAAAAKQELRGYVGSINSEAALLPIEAQLKNFP